MSDPESRNTHEAPTIGGESGSLREYPVRSWDKYKFVASLGEGGMGTVYKAFDPKLNRFVALKFLRGDSPLLRTRFLNEARNQAQIEHPHVCKVYEVGEVQGRFFIAMQYIDGATLGQMSGKLTVEQKVRIIIEIADGIHAAHRIGLIHRDVKPGNIMVEKTEHGWHPCVLDFGLAREMDSQGVTVTGMFVGTPHYMAPEQAWSETQSLDRRVDVYSLGATLYEVLSGQLPITGDNTMTVLRKLAEEEPRPVRQILASVPPDLETVIMKCLEKDPARRYDSARALADDLQRWLDGDPILARRSSLAYRLSKKARKHRAAVSVAAVALVCLLALGIYTIRTAMRSRQRAALSQQFGQQVERINSIMRLSRMSPVHNTTPQKEIVRRRMDEIAKQMRELGDIAQAPGHYALGRGYLSLNDYTKAREHLELAWNSGHREPDAAYALGLVLGHLFEHQLDAAQQIANKEEREKEIRRLEQEYRDPAVAYLRQGTGAEEAAPAYVEGLIDFYQRRFEESLKKAESALEKTPWLYEARVLQGRAYNRIGTNHENAGDYESAGQFYTRSVSALETAIQTGTSDTEAYENLCGLYRQWMHMELFQTGGDVPRLHDQGTKACGLALQVDPVNTEAMLLASQIDTYAAKYTMDHGEDPMTLLESAQGFAQRAVRTTPTAPGYNILATSWRFQAEYELHHGKDPRPSLRRLIEYQDAAARINPRDSHTFENRGSAFMMRAEYEMEHGADPRPALEESIRSFKECVDIAPSAYSCLNSMANAYGIRSDFELENGIEPFASIRGAQQAYEAALRINPKYTHVYNNMGTLKEAEGRWNFSNGKDPRPAFQEALRNYDRTIALNPDYQHPYSNKVVSYWYLARYEVSQGRNPREAEERMQAVLRPPCPAGSGPGPFGAQSARLLAQFRRTCRSGAGAAPRCDTPPPEEETTCRIRGLF